MEQLLPYWHWVVTPVVVVVNLWASVHVVLYKRDTRAAIGWVGVIWLTPMVGSLLYYVLGINRIRRRAYDLRRGHRPVKQAKAPAEGPSAVLDQSFVPDKSQLAPLVRLVSAVTGEHLYPGNRVEPLRGGDQAYPAMLRA